MPSTDAAPTRRSFWPSRKRAKEPIEEEADEKLDLALSRLTKALSDNTEAGREVRRRQSSGQLKIVSAPAGE